LQVEQAGTGKP
jgi:hypothetical protein